MTGPLSASVVFVSALLVSLVGRHETQAQSLEIVVPGSSSFSVEWLELSAGALVPRMTQRFDAGSASLPIEAVGNDSRFVRIIRPRSSPVTIGVSEARSLPMPLTLPERRLGGELFVVLPQKSDMPESLRIGGGSGREVPLKKRHAFGFVSIVGIAPGIYDVAPVYDGGVVGAKETVAIETAASTVLHLSREATGRVLVTAPAQICLLVQTLRLERVVNGRVALVASANGNDECSWSFGGLENAEYRATWFGALTDGIPVPVRANLSHAVEVRLSEGAVTLSGRILLNGKPLGGATLHIGSLGKNLPSSARTDAHGRFVANISEAGTYSIGVLHSGRRIPQSRTITLSRGKQNLEWDIAGRTVKVRLTGHRAGVPSTLIFRSSTGTIRTTVGATTDETTRAGLTPDIYEVYAIQENGPVLTSDIAVVDVRTDPGFDTEVTLTLRRRPSVLRVQDSEGGGPAGVRVLAGPITLGSIARGSGAIPSSEEPGVFDLSGLPGQESLHVIGGGRYVPSCVRKRDEPEVHLGLTIGRSIEVVFPLAGMKTMPVTAGTLTWKGGASCGVPLSHFGSELLSPSRPNTSRFLIRNAPPVDEWLWTPYGVGHSPVTLAVKAGVVRMPSPSLPIGR